MKQTNASLSKFQMCHCNAGTAMHVSRDSFTPIHISMFPGPLKHSSLPKPPLTRSTDRGMNQRSTISLLY